MGRNRKRNDALLGTTEPEEKPNVAVQDEDEKEVEIEPDAPDDDADDEPTEAAPADPAAIGRRAKRQKRLQDLRAEDERKVQERIDAAETARRDAEARSAYAQGLLEAQRQQHPQEDPLEAEIKRAQKRKLELQAIAERMDPAEFEAKKAEMNTEWFSEDRKEKEAIAEVVSRRNGAGRPVDPMAGVRQHLLQKHAGDILQAPAHVQRYGIATFQALVAQGYPDNEETLVLAAQRTREGFPQLFTTAQKRSAPQPRSTMMSVRSTGGTPVNGGEERRTVKMNTKLRGIARAAYPNLPAEQAIQKWAKEHDAWRRKHPEDEHVKGGG